MNMDLGTGANNDFPVSLRWHAFRGQNLSIVCIPLLYVLRDD